MFFNDGVISDSILARKYPKGSVFYFLYEYKCLPVTETFLCNVEIPLYSHFLSKTKQKLSHEKMLSKWSKFGLQFSMWRGSLGVPQIAQDSCQGLPCSYHTAVWSGSPQGNIESSCFSLDQTSKGSS